jgi:hypothetical protein
MTKKKLGSFQFTRENLPIFVLSHTNLPVRKKIAQKISQQLAGIFKTFRHCGSFENDFRVFVRE